MGKKYFSLRNISKLQAEKHKNITQKNLQRKKLTNNHEM